MKSKVTAGNEHIVTKNTSYLRRFRPMSQQSIVKN